ncbi:hypothetical protein EV421DRAFT_1442247 [Armillaria borealis]|uniref:Uncharacterized protein n=1 Tax=Armillaria borealis TaxID=47425 RepID=A0AA39IZC9_9AGAR|nr:hypothetical protein EV421DRAFT_1442247 [Armillaria borealis]
MSSHSVYALKYRLELVSTLLTTRAVIFASLLACYMPSPFIGEHVNRCCSAVGWVNMIFFVSCCSGPYPKVK